MSGFATTGFGRSPYGIGTPGATAPNGGLVLRNTFTNQSTGSRRIDPRSGDYVIDQWGRIEGMDDIQQLVLMAVRTDLGSSAMRDLGNEMRKIDRISSNFQKRVFNTYTNALASLVSKKLITVKSITAVKIGPGRAFVRVVWRDVTKNIEHVEEVAQ